MSMKLPMICASGIFWMQLSICRKMTHKAQKVAVYRNIFYWNSELTLVIEVLSVTFYFCLFKMSFMSSRIVYESSKNAHLRIRANRRCTPWPSPASTFPASLASLWTASTPSPRVPRRPISCASIFSSWDMRRGPDCVTRCLPVQMENPQNGGHVLQRGDLWTNLWRDREICEEEKI